MKRLLFLCIVLWISLALAEEPEQIGLETNIATFSLKNKINEYVYLVSFWLPPYDKIEPDSYMVVWTILITRGKESGQIRERKNFRTEKEGWTYFWLKAKEKSETYKQKEAKK